MEESGRDMETEQGNIGKPRERSVSRISLVTMLHGESFCNYSFHNALPRRGTLKRLF